jgi:hypothetical protein
MLIDLILTDRRFYTYEGYVAGQVKQVFEKWSVPHRILYLTDGGLSDYLSTIQTDRPDWTLGFSMLTPHQRPLCDLIQIPHFYWTEGSITPALNFLQSEFGKVGIHDQRIGSNYPNVYYLPHGVNRSRQETNFPFDLVLFADLVDLNFLRETWLEVLSMEQIERVERAIELEDPLQAGPQFAYAEKYLKARETYQMIMGLGQEVRLDVFGEHAGNNWLIRLPSHVHLHAPLPYSEHFEVLRASKMVPISPSNPWYFPAIAAGSLPMTPDRVTYYLNHPHERKRELDRLKPQQLERTWESQIEKLMGYMS